MRLEQVAGTFNILHQGYNESRIFEVRTRHMISGGHTNRK